MSRHFPTKQDLVDATVVRHLGKLEDEARRLAPAAEGLRAPSAGSGQPGEVSATR